MERSMLADAESTLVLGGAFEQSLPQRVESTGAFSPSFLFCQFCLSVCLSVYLSRSLARERSLFDCDTAAVG